MNTGAADLTEAVRQLAALNNPVTALTGRVITLSPQVRLGGYGGSSAVVGPSAVTFRDQRGRH